MSERDSAEGELPEDPRDSLHILPLDMLPIKTPGLKRARLIKNSRLETMVEMFREEGSGSGQVDPRLLEGFFEGFEEELKHDIGIIQRLSRSPSYDVYSLRIYLREMGISVENEEALKLSAAKQAELGKAMQEFTRPLIIHVYGDQKLGDVDNVVDLLRNPNRAEAIANLKLMADKLKVTLPEIPKFLEDYGDIFLSLAYFRNALDKVVPASHEFLEWLEELRDTWQLRNDRQLDRILTQINADLTDITGSVTGRFEAFDRKTQDFWRDINADRFHEVRRLILSNHKTVGGVLCGLSLKMDLWKNRFRGKKSVGPQQRIEFVKAEIQPGLNWIKDLETAARR